MDLRKFSDQELLESTRQLVGAERRLVTALLHHLNEIAERRLFAKESCPSLFVYCTRVLRFTERQAQIRIRSARLMKEFPEIDSKITSGDLTLSNLSLIYSHLKNKGSSREEKQKLLTICERKSTREVDKIVAAIEPRKSRETVRAISNDLTELRFTVDNELLKKIDRLRQILRTNSMEQIVGRMVHVALEKFDPLRKAERAQKRRAASTTLSVNSRHIPAHVRHAVWLRDQGRCTYPGCGSRYGLELDHIILFCHGGPNTPENLRLRCRAHNQLHAEEQLGEKKMKQHRP